jgi:hypothetical protein
MVCGRSVFLTLIVAITSAGAQAASPYSLATPPNGFSFDGRWSCTGSFGNGKPHRSSYEGSNIFGSAIYLGPGWQNSTLILTSVPDPDPKAFQNRFVFRVADPSHFSVNWEVNRKNHWAVGEHLECSPEARS